MVFKPENISIKTQNRICLKCGKEYTINTSNQEENLANYPAICLWCQNESIHKEIREYAQSIKNKDKTDNPDHK